MNILLWIILGGLAGWIASMIMKTNASQGLFADIIIGIIGAFIGGFVASMLGGSGVTGFNFYSLLIAVIGAVVLIWIMRMFRRA